MENDVKYLCRVDTLFIKVPNHLFNTLTGGAPGSALSLYYNTVAKPGAKAINKLDQNLKNYIINTVIRSNNGMC